MSVKSKKVFKFKLSIYLLLVLIFLHNFLDVVKIGIGPLNEPLTFYVSMIVMIYTSYWALTLRCSNPDCKKIQICRDKHFSSWRWPSDDCYHCGSKLP